MVENHTNRLFKLVYSLKMVFFFRHIRHISDYQKSLEYVSHTQIENLCLGMRLRVKLATPISSTLYMSIKSETGHAHFMFIIHVD